MKASVLLAYVAFVNNAIKVRVKRFLSDSTNSMEIILRQSVEVRLILLPSSKELLDFNNLHETSRLSQKGEACTIAKRNEGNIDDNIEDTPHQKSLKVIGRSPQSIQLSSQLIVRKTGNKVEGKQEIPVQRTESIIRHQMLETAWLQVTEKGSPGTMSCLKLEKSLVSHDDTIQVGDQVETALDSQYWEDELNRELKALKLNDMKAYA